MSVSTIAKATAVRNPTNKLVVDRLSTFDGVWSAEAIPIIEYAPSIFIGTTTKVAPHYFLSINTPNIGVGNTTIFRLFLPDFDETYDMVSASIQYGDNTGELNISPRRETGAIDVLVKNMSATEVFTTTLTIGISIVKILTLSR